MMCEETPVSVSHLGGFARVASTLLGAPVIPTRAKGVLYDGGTAWHRDSDHPVTSIGVAAFPSPGLESVEDFFAAADQALYRAKAEGRNRVRS